RVGVSRRGLGSGGTRGLSPPSTPSTGREPGAEQDVRGAGSVRAGTPPGPCVSGAGPGLRLGTKTPPQPNHGLRGRFVAHRRSLRSQSSNGSSVGYGFSVGAVASWRDTRACTVSHSARVCASCARISSMSACMAGVHRTAAVGVQRVSTPRVGVSGRSWVCRRTHRPTIWVGSVSVMVFLSRGLMGGAPDAVGVGAHLPGGAVVVGGGTGRDLVHVRGVDQQGLVAVVVHDGADASGGVAADAVPGGGLKHRGLLG